MLNKLKISNVVQNNLWSQIVLLVPPNIRMRVWEDIECKVQREILYQFFEPIRDQLKISVINKISNTNKD